MQAMPALQTGEPPLSEAAATMMREGYLIIENAIDPQTLGALDAEMAPRFEAARFGTGAFFGPETRRFGRVLAHSRAAAELVLDTAVLGVVRELLAPACDSIQLSLTQGIEIHPGAPAQPPHRDQDMWRIPCGTMECMVNVMWALDDFTERNGATRVWPGSHRHGLDQIMLPEDEAIAMAMPAGSVALFLGSVMHSGGANLSAAPRRGLLVSYCLGWLKPWENQWLAYPPEVARRFPPELAELVGYCQHRPSLGNYEGQCPSVLLREPGGRDTAWTDTLLPEQGALAEQYREMQLSMRLAA